MKTKHYAFSFISVVLLAITTHAGVCTPKSINGNALVPVELNASPNTCGANALITDEGSELTSTCTFTVSASVNASVSCNGGNNGSASASGSSGITPYTYLWSNKSTGATASGLSSGTYTIIASDASGCTATATVSITQPTRLNVSIAKQSNVSCNGGNNACVYISVSGGTSPYTYTNPTCNLSAGTYTLSVTDANGCPGTVTVNITQPSALTLSVTVNSNVACNGGSNGGATPNPSGGTSPYKYSWSNGGNGSNLSAGSYTVTVTDGDGCTATASVNITQPSAALSASAMVNANIACFGFKNGSATASGSGGITPYTYTWSNGGFSPTATGLSTGTYTVTVLDRNGCTATASVNITQPLQLAVTINSVVNIKCNGYCTGSASPNISGGTTPYTYSWSNGSTDMVNSNLCAGTYTISVTDDNGCTATASYAITQPVPLHITADSAKDNGSCNGSAWLKVAGGASPYTYLWSPGGETSDTIKNQCAGLYCCTVTDNNGCKDTLCITINLSTGINNTSSSSGITIYPNPTSGKFIIQLVGTQNFVSRQWSVEVYNVFGEKVFSKLSNVHFPLSIDLSEQPNQIYLIRILNANGTLVSMNKVVKTN